MAEADLKAQGPCAGLLPVAIAGCRLAEVIPGHITSLMPFNGQAAVLSEALGAAHGMAFPKPNRSTGKIGARCLWAGRGQAFLIGPAPDVGLAEFAAVTDQSDAWAVVALEGDMSEAVLARLTPLDLRRSRFKRGHTARSLLGHMTASITRTGPVSFEIMVFRSMAQTLVHELTFAMTSVAARGKVTPSR